MSSRHAKDYYGILGVPRNAGDSEIKAAFRKLALRNHPDTNRDDPEAEDRFKEIGEAYEVLGHRDRRNLYDLGRDPLAGGFPFRSSPFYPWGDRLEESVFSGFRCRGGGFGRAFGRRRRAFHKAGEGAASFEPSPHGGRIQDIPLTSDEAFRGAERDSRLHRGGDTTGFTVSIPPGVTEGTVLNLKRLIGDGEEIEFRFRVRIVE